MTKRGSKKTISPFSSRNLQGMLKVALDAGDAAAKIQAKYFRRKIEVREKGDEGLVTEVDLRSEELIIRRLRRAYPDIRVIGEESATDLNVAEGEAVWHVDPLDGTTNYARGLPVYCVSIGMAVGNQPILGVIVAPSLNETFYSREGGGAFCNRKRMQVSKRARMRDCVFGTGFAYKSDASLAKEIERFREVSSRSLAVRRPGAAAMDLAYLALGVYDGYWERGLKSWDTCAGLSLVQEAGGTITNYENKDFQFSEQEVLASNGQIHKELHKLLKLT